MRPIGRLAGGPIEDASGLIYLAAIAASQADSAQAER